MKDLSKGASKFFLFEEYVDDMNVAIQRFENNLGHGVRTVDLDAGETVEHTRYPSKAAADIAYWEAVGKAKAAA